MTSLKTLPVFSTKALALGHMASSQDNTDLHMFGSDGQAGKGWKQFVVGTKRDAFRYIYPDKKARHTGKPHPERHLYESFEVDTPVALSIDMDIPCLDEHNPCTENVLELIDLLADRLDTKFHLHISIRDFIVTKSPYKVNKLEQSYHLKLVGYRFANPGALRDLVLQLDIIQSSQDPRYPDDRTKTVQNIDTTIYRPGLLRLTGCSKKGSARVLTPFALQHPATKLCSLMPSDFSSFEEYWMQSCMTTVDGYKFVAVEQMSVKQLVKVVHEAPESEGAMMIADLGVSSSCKVTSTVLIQELVRILPDSFAAQYSTWRDLCFILVNSISLPAQFDALFEVFDTFSRRATYAGIDDVTKFWKGAYESSRRFHGRKNSLGTLYHWAKQADVEAFKRIMRTLYVPMCLVKELDAVYPDTMDMIQYNEQYCQSFPVDRYDTLVVESAMGSGKTQQVVQVIQHAKRVLWFSSRVIYASTIRQRLWEDHAIYLPGHDEGDGADLSYMPKLVISPESVHRVDNYPMYDVVVVDESEAVLAQFESADTVKRPGDSYTTFVKLLMNAKTLLFLDALVSRKTMALVSQLFTPVTSEEPTLWNRRSNPVIIRNTFRAEGKTAVFLRHTVSLQAGQDAFISRILEQLLAGKRVACFSASATFAKKLVSRVLEAQPGIAHLLYTAETDDQDKHIKEVNELWSQQFLVVYSPCITTGLDYCTRDVFSSVWAYLTASSVNCRDSAQAVHRVRHTIEKKLYFMIDTQCTVQCLSTLHSVEARIATNNSRVTKQFTAMAADKGRLSIEELDSIFESMPDCTATQLMAAQRKAALHKADIVSHDVPKIVLQNKALNELENDLHRRYFKAVFCNLIESIGYELREEFLTDETVQDTIDVESESLYDRTPAIDQDTYNKYRIDVNHSRATNLQKVAIRKYEFDALLSSHNLNPDAKASMFDLMWTGPKASARRLLFNHVFTEIHADPDDLQRSELERVRYFELLGSVVSSLKLVKEVCRILGLRSTVDTQTTFTTDDIKSNVDLLLPKLTEIGGFMKIQLRSKEESKEAQVRSLLKGLFSTWSGMTMRPDAGSKRTKNERVSSYKLCTSDDFVALLKHLVE